MQYLEIALRLAAATLAGGVLGLDREILSKPAGLRTHALVALGSAVATVTTIEFIEGGDPTVVTRTVQGIIAGVGFLGGGAILRARDNDTVKGLTTAASIWLVAGLGIACGGGLWATAVITVLLGILVLVLGRPVEAVLHKVLRSNHNEPPNE